MEDDEHVALHLNFIPEGWLLDYPSSSANSKHLSSSPPRMKVLYNCSIISQTDFPNCSIISLTVLLEWPIPSKPLIVCVITTQVYSTAALAMGFVATVFPLML